MPFNVYGAAGSSGYQRCSQSKSQGASELIWLVKLQVSLLRLVFVGWLILILIHLIFNNHTPLICFSKEHLRLTETGPSSNWIR